MPTGLADGEACEKALAAFWQNPTHQNACAYLTALLPVLRSLRATEKVDARTDAPPLEFKPFTIGPYTCDTWLGEGTEGMVFKDSEKQVAVKMNARGDGILHALLPDWSDDLLGRVACGLYSQTYTWVARELADETLHTFLQREGPLSFDNALMVFDVACRGVAWLHEQHVYGWSAHAKNVYRIGERWRLGDFGRTWTFRASDHPLVDGAWRDSFGHWGGTGVLAYDSEREHRLALDDCSMLGGLLVQMLTGKRWEWLFRALNKRPYCSAVYPLTGDKRRDSKLSQILNRCWRGEAGGAPLLANGDRGEQSVYEDPLELLDDVGGVLDSRTIGP